MTQNLDLDLNDAIPLIPETSNVSKEWVPATTYTNTWDGSAYYFSNQSWNLGEAVLKNPNSSDSCSPLMGKNLYDSTCTDYWQNVSSGWTPMTEYRTDGVTYDANTQTYDAHYLAGNYYSWQAATAGTGSGTTEDGDVATDSICPYGWQLPLSGKDNDMVSGSFNNLLKQYELLDSPTNHIEHPLYFVPSGLVLSDTRHHLNYAGRYGNYWSSVASSSTETYAIYFGSTGVYDTSDSDARYWGHPIRCFAPGA